MTKPDTIEIRRLIVPTFIGVPDEERAQQQVVYVSVSMTPTLPFHLMHDQIHHTVDYYQASLKILEIGLAKPRKLIESLCSEITDFLLQSYPIQSVSVTIEKQILPNTDFVAVSMTRPHPTSTEP